MGRVVWWWFSIGPIVAFGGGVRLWWPLAALGFLSWAVTPFLLLPAALWHAVRPDRRRRGLLLAIVVVVGAWIQAQIFLAAGSSADRLYFWRQVDRYERLLGRSDLDAGKPRWQCIEGVMVVVQPGEPRRVAFPLPGGLLDNWRGVVYDPSGEAMRVNALEKWSDQWRDDPVAGWFGGDMVECRHLRDHFYLCSFT